MSSFSKALYIKKVFFLIYSLSYPLFTIYISYILLIILVPVEKFFLLRRPYLVFPISAKELLFLLCYYTSLFMLFSSMYHNIR